MKREKDAEKFSKGSAVRHKAALDDLESTIEELVEAENRIELDAYIYGQLSALEQEYGFDPGMDLNDCDTTTWGDAKQRGYGAYMALLTVRDKMKGEGE